MEEWTGPDGDIDFDAVVEWVQGWEGVDRDHMNRFIEALEWKQGIVENARGEEQDWRTDDSKAGEASMPDKMEDYYGAVGQWAVDSYAEGASDDSEPWSAAFISYVVKQAGVTEADGFEFSVAHLRYVVHALLNRKNEDLDRPFWLYEPDEVRPQVGDILCKNRGGGFTADRLANTYIEEDPSGDGTEYRIKPDASIGGVSHCDVVVSTEEGPDGTLFFETLGGNTYDYEEEMYDTVGRKRWKVTDDGPVLVNAAGEVSDVWDPDEDRVFGFIRVVAWEILASGGVEV